jgi:hypothetical protein
MVPSDEERNASVVTPLDKVLETEWIEEFERALKSLPPDEQLAFCAANGINESPSIPQLAEQQKRKPQHFYYLAKRAKASLATKLTRRGMRPW